MPLEPWRWLLLGALGPCACASDGPASTGPRSTPSACVASSPLGGGWEQCENGMLHRPQAGQCSSQLPRPGVRPTLGGSESTNASGTGDAGRADAGGAPTQSPECLQDSDCTAKPHGHCEVDVAIYCQYGCVTDADCDADQACLCGELIGRCAPASCRTDADCEGSALCGSYSVCYGEGFSCQTAADECSGAGDCSNGEACTRVLSGAGPELSDDRTCRTLLCAVPGRPFLIAGSAQQAPAVARGDWYPASRSSAPQAVLGDPELRAAIARGWAAQALMEHASVAAFARFTLQLMQLGAPAGLVAAASEAMADEIRHARACFELARRHSDADVGPGPLAVDGALAGGDLESIVLETVREGCIGETLAALEAAEALEHCEDAAARPVLEAIAREEMRHAELAWRFVAWALDSAPASLAASVRRAFAEALAPAPAAPIATRDRDLARHGLLSEAVRHALQQRVRRAVIVPCAEALLSRAKRQSRTAADAAHAA